MHEVVVMAVRNAVSAATTTFTAISMKRFFIIINYQFSIFNCEALVLSSRFGVATAAGVASAIVTT